jgi:nucleotide-binding universal stress UspA family protein
VRTHRARCHRRHTGACQNATVSDHPTVQESSHAFSRVRRRAGLRTLLRALGRNDDPLLSYDDVRRRLHAVESALPVLEDVPLSAIVGSVGRYNDFTREFLPKDDSDKDRWVGVRLAMQSQSGTPPVELYRIGEAYFVRDGNHRVSVARQLGAPTIQAYVTPVHVRVPLSAAARPDDVILAEEQARFLEETELDEVRPGADVRLTVPGGYRALHEHISVHRYYMGLERGREVAPREAVEHWYDTVYRSVVEAIHAGDMLRDFPGRTEADLYLWLSDHRGRLADELGFEIRSETIAEHRRAPPRLSAVERAEVLEGLRRMPPESRSGTMVLIDDVLVVVERGEAGWRAVEQALAVAQREGARLSGLHVESATDAAEAVDHAQALRARFADACAAAGVASQFTTAVGAPGAQVRERLPWFDLVVLPLVERDADGDARISASLGSVLRREGRPLLSVGTAVSPLSRALVAFDGGRKAREALFAAAYLATKWGTSLVVATVTELARPNGGTLDEARRYLEGFEIAADYVSTRGPVVESLVGVAEERGCDLIVMGSHRYSRLIESMLGGVVVRTLLGAPCPVLIV